MSLEDAVRHLDLHGEVQMNGKWARLDGAHCTFYVVELSHSRGYFSWCDHPCERIVEYHAELVTAVLSGLRRAANPGHDRSMDPC